MNYPLVSVIIISHNQSKFLEKCINSVLEQTYPNLEIIIVDDESTDYSREIINKYCSKYSDIKSIFINHSGNCAAFNIGFTQSKGEYIVDLAADDFFYPERHEKQVEKFLSLPNDFGIIHTDANYLDEEGNFIGKHFDFVKSIHKISKMPEGFVFYELIQKYFVSSPSMLVKRAVFEDLNGYDETLSYEDFDFWIRSSYKWKYHYMDEVLTNIHKHKASMSAKQYRKDNPMVKSTFLVCEKVLKLDSSTKTKRALRKRVAYEWRMAVKHLNVYWIFQWLRYYIKLGGNFAKIFI